MALKEYSIKFMGEERAVKHLETLERATHQMVTESDFRNFVQLLADVYESAYLKAYDDCKEQFVKHGINVQMGTELR